jgi:hypothetical protein
LAKEPLPRLDATVGEIVRILPGRFPRNDNPRWRRFRPANVHAPNYSDFGGLVDCSSTVPLEMLEAIRDVGGEP